MKREIVAQFFSIIVGLIIAYPKQKMNVFGSQILFGSLIDPEMVIFHASIFGYCFRVGPQQKKGSIFG